VARYSVYDYTRKVYDYYEGSGPGGTHAGVPALSGFSSSGVGSTPEQAAWRVPADARKVGSGELPQGKIATQGGYESQSPLVQLGLLAGAVFVAWKVFR
jgi:hypothetical protein